MINDFRFVVFLDALEVSAMVTVSAVVKGDLNPKAAICTEVPGMSRAWPQYQGTGAAGLP